MLGDPQGPVPKKACRAARLGSEPRAAKVHVSDVEAGPGGDRAAQEGQAARQVGDAARRDAKAPLAELVNRPEGAAVGLGAPDVHVALVGLVPELPGVHAGPGVLHDGDHVAGVLVRVGRGALPGHVGRGPGRADRHAGGGAAEDAEDADAVAAAERDDLVEVREVVAIAGWRADHDALHLDVETHDLRARGLRRRHQTPPIRLRRAAGVDHRVRLDRGRGGGGTADRRQCQADSHREGEDDERPVPGQGGLLPRRAGFPGAGRASLGERDGPATHAQVDAERPLEEALPAAMHHLRPPVTCQ
jgi:hypothetical protein